MKKLKCTVCSARFADTDFQSDEQLCPTCGGRVEAESVPPEGATGQEVARQEQMSIKTITLIVSVVVALLGVAIGTYVWYLTGGKRLSFSHPTAGIKKVVLRASNASKATVTVSNQAEQKIQVSGIADGGAKGYHSPNPFWHETPPGRWGLGFTAKQFGSTLVISTVNEISYIEIHYDVSNLALQLPEGVTFELQDRHLNGQGAPDLSEPNLAVPGS